MDKSHAHAELRSWMERSGRGPVEVAQALQITRPHLRHLTTGGRSPSLALALRIADMTGIPPSAWTKVIPARKAS